MSAVKILARISWGCVFASLSASLAAQDTAATGAIAGAVTNSNGQPAANVEVCIETMDRCTSTAETGQFGFQNLRTGWYVLRFRAPEALELSSESVEVRAGVEVQVEAALPLADALQQSVTVTAPAFVAAEEVKNSGYLVQGTEVFKSAGTL